MKNAVIEEQITLNYQMDYIQATNKATNVRVNWNKERLNIILWTSYGLKINKNNVKQKYKNTDIGY